jgi:hypothetical protein
MAAKTAKIETMSGWAGFAKAALDVLGKAAPWVVIGCLSAFGIYKLQELNGQNLAAVQAIAEKERTQARNDFSVANQALKDTYEAANKLYTEMIASVGSSLKQLQQLETEVRDKQKSVYESQIAAERTKSPSGDVCECKNDDRVATWMGIRESRKTGWRKDYVDRRARTHSIWRSF